MFRKSSIQAATPVDGDDDDSISINSTEGSQFSEDHEYEVERVLAERISNGKHYYLLEWKGYPLSRSTWEPKEHIYDDNILVHWKETKSRESRGIARPFDVKKFEADVEKLIEDKAERQRRRKLKRRRSGLPVSESDSESDNYMASDSDSIGEAIEAEDERDDSPELQDTYDPRPKSSKTPTIPLVKDKGTKLPNTNPRHSSSSSSLGEEIPRRGSHEIPIRSSSKDVLPQRTSKATSAGENLSVPAKDNRKDLSKRDISGSKLDRPSVTSGRREGATRGTAVTQKNVFAIRNPPRKRPTLLQNSADPTKEMKHFKNMRIVRKAELASRALEDAAPDINAAGGLFKPGDDSTFRSLNVAGLRRNLATTGTQQGPAEVPQTPQTDPLPSAGEIELASSKPTSNQSVVKTPYVGPAICYYWNTKGNCARGYQCKYLHASKPGAPVAANPADRRDQTRPQIAVDETASSHSSLPDDSAPGNAARTDRGQEPQYRSLLQNDTLPSTTPQGPRVKAPIHDEICWFWHSKGSCSKGELCVFYHVDDQSIPVAQDPTRPARDRPRANSPTSSDRKSTVCPHWRRGDCHHGKDCWFAHAEPHESKSERSLEAPEAGDPLAHPPRLLARKLDTSRYVAPTAHMDSRSSFQEDDSIEPFTAVSSPRRQSGGPDLAQPGIAERIPSTPESVPTSATEHREAGVRDVQDDQAVQVQGSWTKMVTFGMYGEHALLFDTPDTSKKAQHPKYQEFLGLSRIRFDQVCIAPDFESQHMALQRCAIWDGSITPVDTGDLVASKVIDDIVKDLRLRASGLICFAESLLILCYPARADEWKFIDRSPYPREVRMRYLLIQTDLNIDSCFAMPVKDTVPCRPPYRKSLMYKIHGLSIDKLVPPFEKGHSINNFYLLFPPTANETAYFITQWLRNSSHGCNVYSSDIEGSWDFVVNSSTVQACTVLIHEFVAAEIYRLPLLQEILRKSKKVFNFWYIPESGSPFPMFPSVLAPDDSNLGQVTMTRIFPHGAVIFLAPSFLIAEPERTYELLKWFFYKKLDSVTPGTWKLASCYNLTDYMLDLANAKALERQRFYEENPDKPSKDAEANNRGLGFESCQLRYKIHTFLTSALQARDASRRAPPIDCLDYYSGIPDELESPIIYSDRYIDQEDEHAQIKWFAGWAMGRLDLFRKFTVIGSGRGSINKSTRLKSLPTRTPNSNTQPDMTMPLSKPASPDNIPSATDSGPHLKNSAHTLKTAVQKALAVAAKIQAARVISSNSASGPVTKCSTAESQSGNPVSEHVVAFTPHADKMDVDLVSASPTTDVNEGSTESNDGTAGVELKLVRFEPTTEWYKRMKDDGDGWEHVMVDGWEQGWIYLGISKK